MREYPAGLILLVTGSTLRAEHMDRPLAYFLQSKLEEIGNGSEDRIALVISDRYYLSHPDLHHLPMISVGGPGVNRVARKLLKKLPAVMVVDQKFFIQFQSNDTHLRASIWGMDNPQTRMAIVTFAERYLPEFARLSWERTS